MNPSITSDHETLGAIVLPNRIVMSPMGRQRAGPDGTPTASMAEYYRQRATAGLIITESTHPLLDGKAQPGSPHLIDADDLEGWRRVVDGVHAAHGRIALQLMHAGSAAHPAVNGGSTPIAPSAVAPTATTNLGPEVVPYPVPREMDGGDLERVVEGFAEGARTAMRAGFDGVEVHGGNGYLLHQFLATGTNRRDDDYGGSRLRRLRFPVEVVEAVAGAVGHDRVGLRISPGGSANEVVEDDLPGTYADLLDTPAVRQLAWVHTTVRTDAAMMAQLRATGRRPWIHNPGTAPDPDADAVARRVREELAGGPTAVALGRLYIANPDLVERLKRGTELALPDPTTFYGPGDGGYTDYPRARPAVAWAAS